MEVRNEKIWLDDIRDPKDFGQPDAKWVKSAQELFMLNLYLADSGKIDEVEEIHFDNDLGEHSPEGYYCFTKLEQMLHHGAYKGLKRVYVHSSNPSAVHKFMLAAPSFKDHFNVEVIRNPL